MNDDRDVLDVISQLIEADRQFYGVVRFLDGTHRTHVVAAHQRNTNLTLLLLREYMRSNPSPNVTITVPIPPGAFDLSGNFFDPVPVVPSADQIRNAIESHVDVHDQTCAICQEAVACATRIRHCGHCFHSGCISEWFTMNSRCPVCRHDIRLDTPVRRTINVPQGNRVYADEE